MVNNEYFDELTKALTAARSRRGVLKAFGATVLAVATDLLPGRTVLAAPNGHAAAATVPQRCSSQRPCPAGLTCCRGLCVPTIPGSSTPIDNNNCGGCGKRCTRGKICCLEEGGLSATCVDPQTNHDNCGACFSTDNVHFNDAAKCDPVGTGKTDSSARDACCKGTCVNVNFNENNCGRCGKVCLPNTPNIKCCDGRCTDINLDEKNCGGCANDEADPGAVPGRPKVCAKTETCCPAVRDQQGVTGPGCTDLQTDEMNCGRCGNQCSSNKQCCNGRCIDITSDEQHCGACGNNCAAGNVCCDGKCRDLKSDPDACGACGNVCPTHTFNELTYQEICCLVNGSPTCVDPLTNSLHCGGCNRRCPGEQVCRGGICVRPCADEPGGESCPAGQTCCDGTCCNNGEKCCAGGICCNTTETCCGASCCRPGQRCCAGRCVPEGHLCCDDGTSCPPGTTCCGNGQCAPAGGRCCGNSVCNPGQKCCGTVQGQPTCIPEAHICCDDGTSCPPGTRCCGNGQCAPAEGSCCVNTVCQPGFKCCNGRCIANERTCCGSTDCGPNQRCCGNHCCQAGQTCCGDSACCGGSQTCCNGQCCAPGAPCGRRADGTAGCCNAGDILCAGDCCSGKCCSGKCCGANDICCGHVNCCSPNQRCCINTCCNRDAFCFFTKCCDTSCSFLGVPTCLCCEGDCDFGFCDGDCHCSPFDCPIPP